MQHTSSESNKATSPTRELFGFRFETLVLIPVVLAFGVLMVTAGWWFCWQGGNHTTAIPITYNQDPQALRVYHIPHQRISLRVLDIGTIEAGPYKGDKLALALYSFFETPEWSPEDDIPFASNYAYFIADETGSAIAWDIRYLHDLARCGYNGCKQGYLREFLGLTDELAADLSFLPVEFTVFDNKHVYGELGLFSRGGQLSYGGAKRMQGVQIGTTPSGFAIMLYPHDDYWSYELVFPFARSHYLSSEADFMYVDGMETDIPQLQWMTGTTTVSSYERGLRSWWEDCYEPPLNVLLYDTFVQTGVTNHGDPVYETDPEKYPEVYQCLFEMTAQYEYDIETRADRIVGYPMPYEEFVHTHPLFFWEHPSGELMPFLYEDIRPRPDPPMPSLPPAV